MYQGQGYTWTFETVCSEAIVISALYLLESLISSLQPASIYAIGETQILSIEGHEKDKVDYFEDANRG